MINQKLVQHGPISNPAPVLLYSPREAAIALAISERTLWRWTKRGLIPHVKIGRLTRYPVKELCSWVKNSQQHGFYGDEALSDTHGLGVEDL